jgi:MFS family permease
MGAAAPGRSGFGSVLEIHGAPRLLASSVIGRMPLGMLTLGVLLLVQQEYSSFALAGLAVGALAFGCAVAAPVQGALVDRHGASGVLAPVAFAQAVATCGLAAAAALSAPRGAVVVLALLVGMLTPPVSATLRMTWMNVTDAGPVRDAAFALDAMTTQLLFALGPLLTAVCVQFAGTAVTVALAGLISFAGTLVFAGAAPIKVATDRRSRARALAAERGESFRLVVALRSPAFRVVLVTVVLVGWAGGAIEVGLSGLAVDLGSRPVSGVLIGLWCMGGVTGGWFYGRRAWHASIEMRHQVAAAAGALAALPLVAAESIPVAMALSFVAGLPWAAVFACQYQMVAAKAPEHAVAEAFTWNFSAIIGGTAIGSAVAGVVVSDVGVHACFALSAAMLMCAFGWEALTARRPAAAAA